MVKNKKGFTLVEVLVTIVIIGFLFTLGYFSISAILNRADDNYYSSQENMIVLAGREYFADYRSELPKEVSETSSVTLETLIKEGYIDPVKDRNDKACDYAGSSVTAQKITNSEYQYYVTLICSEDDYETSKDSAEPVITFSPNSKSSTEAITVKLEVKDNVGVASYRYVIEKDGDVYVDTDYQAYTDTVNIELKEKGLYTIRAYAIDTSGNIGTAKSGKYSIYEGIDCAGVEFTGSTKEETWTNKDITVGIKVPDNTYSFELSKRTNSGEYSLIDSYVGQVSPSYTITDEGKTEIKVTVYDKDGNSCIAVSDAYYIDKTSPSCSVGISGTVGENGWYKEKNATITLNRSDNLSEVTDYGLTTSSTATYNKTASASQGNTSGTTWYGYVKDAAGNTSKCSNTVKVDVTKPSCSISTSGASGSSGWYKSNVTLLLTRSDNLSDISSFGLTTSSAITYNRTSIATQGATTGTVWHGYVKDEAGNTNSCNVTVKSDTSKPSVSLTVSSTSSSYNTKNVNYSISASDSGSGVSKYCFTAGSSCTPNTTTKSGSNISVGFSKYDGSSKTLTACVSDKSGNVACTSKSYKVYKECTTTVANGAATCGSYGSCDCNSGKQYATKTQNMKDAYTGAACPAVVTANGCSQSCSCCSTANPEGCQVIYTCRVGKTYFYSGTDKYAAKFVGRGVAMRLIGQVGDMYYVWSPSFIEDNPYYPDPQNFGYIHTNCTTTNPTGICTAAECPDS